MKQDKKFICEVFDQTFFKKFVGCGAKPHDLHTDAQSLVFPRLPAGVGFILRRGEE
jgi:hypothetical protein